MAPTAVSSLLHSDLDEAFLIASLGATDLNPETWRQEALAHLAESENGGILVAKGRSGRVCGLLRFRIARDRVAAPSLAVERLVAFHLMDPQAVANDLIADAIRRARAKDCLTLTLTHPLEASPKAAALVLASGVADLHSVF